MTEDEAYTKWCPMARVGGPMHTEAQGTSYNRWPGSDGSTEAMLYESRMALCIGSSCMAWRQKRRGNGFLVSLDGGRWKKWSWDPSEDAMFSGRVQVREVDVADGGYCGLAGRSE